MTVSLSSIPTEEPATLRAGDTATWKKTLSDYPAPAWTLTYTLINAAGKISITAAASGIDHLVEVTAATTAGYAVGEYDWIAAVTKGSERYTIGHGRIEVLKDLAAAGTTTYDARSHARKVLDAIESALESRATNDQLDVLATTFGDRSITRDRNALLRWRGVYRAEVMAEERAAGRGNSGRILVRLA